MLARILSLLIVVGFSGQSKPIDLFDSVPGDQSSSDEPTQITVSGVDGVDDSGAGTYGKPIVLEFNRGTGGILVPATVNGKKAYFLFDTGATLTSITPAFMKYVSASVAQDSPSTSFSTANGIVDMKLGILSKLKLDKKTHRGVTFAVCGACPASMHRGLPVAGVLGLNVIGRYRVQYNDAEGKIEMYPNKGHANRFRDIEPFLHLSDWDVNSKGKLSGSVRITNRSTRAVRELSLKFYCGDSSSKSKTMSIGARKGKKVKFSMKKSRECERIHPVISHVSW